MVGKLIINIGGQSWCNFLTYVEEHFETPKPSGLREYNPLLGQTKYSNAIH